MKTTIKKKKKQGSLTTQCPPLRRQVHRGAKSIVDNGHVVPAASGAYSADAARMREPNRIYQSVQDGDGLIYVCFRSRYVCWQKTAAIRGRIRPARHIDIFWQVIIPAAVGRKSWKEGDSMRRFSILCRYHFMSECALCGVLLLWVRSDSRLRVRVTHCCGAMFDKFLNVSENVIRVIFQKL